MKKNSKHFLSVVIPAYKEKNIISDLITIYGVLEKIRYPFEVIVVVDGINVDDTYALAKRVKRKHLSIHGYPTNHGKGYALRYGMARAKGDYIAFIDAGMEIDPNGISLLIEHLEWYNADIIVASKYHPASQVKYPLDRRIVSFMGHVFAKYFLNLNLTDTQAGLKLFKSKVLKKVLPRLLVKNYAIDLEMLSVAKHLGFNKIYEAPVKLRYSISSLNHAAGLKVIFNSFKDALAVFYRLKILRYYDDQNQRRWVYDPELAMRINVG